VSDSSIVTARRRARNLRMVVPPYYFMCTNAIARVREHPVKNGKNGTKRRKTILPEAPRQKTHRLAGRKTQTPEPQPTL
ncbi:MAG: hypothetical protein PHY12_13355, partial [Eubacteriales bacterium]|nr:hypothetical protein [Eubacteriales bacterium]